MNQPLNDEEWAFIQKINQNFQEFGEELNKIDTTLPESLLNPPLLPESKFSILASWLSYPSWQLPDLLTIRSTSMIIMPISMLLVIFLIQVIFYFSLGV